jgi:hypothetical protein
MKIGTKVVCILNGTNSVGNQVIKGRIYTIEDILDCPKCPLIWIDVGLRCESNTDECLCGYFRGSANIVWVDHRYFRPIEYNTAHEELIKKEVIEEKSDIPLEVPTEEPV